MPWRCSREGTSQDTAGGWQTEDPGLCAPSFRWRCDRLLYQGDDQELPSAGWLLISLVMSVVAGAASSDDDMEGQTCIMPLLGGLVNGG